MRILIVEDEQDLRNAIKHYLEALNYTCEAVSTYMEGLQKLSSFSYNCILLDLGLPGGDGLKLLEEIRHQGKDDGVIIVSARGGLEDKIKGLQLGADDYLAKPFHLAELGARVHSVIRRKEFNNTNIITINKLTINLLEWEASVDHHKIPLTKTEFDLLLFLVGSKNRVVSKSAVAEHLLGEISDTLDNYDIVYSHLKNLKKKLADAGLADPVKTIYGVGYKWVSE